jgi:hypothetical protein
MLTGGDRDTDILALKLREIGALDETSSNLNPSHISMTATLEVTAYDHDVWWAIRQSLSAELDQILEAHFLSEAKRLEGR